MASRKARFGGKALWRAAALGLACVAVAVPPIQAQDVPDLPAEPWRTVSGRFDLPPESVLTPGAVFVVEARGPRNALLAESRLPVADGTGLTYALDLPVGPAATLRAAIQIDGQARWLSDPVAIPAGEAPVEAEPATLAPVVVSVLSQTMLCGTLRITAGMNGADAVITADGEQFVLAPVEAASGARFSDGADPETSFWNKGTVATLTLRGEVLPECRTLDAPPPELYEAQGVGWALTVTGADYLLVVDGFLPLEGRVPAAVWADGAAVWRLAEGAEVRMAPEVCLDPGGGQPLPETVTVTWPGQLRDGCGGRILDTLAGAPWRVIGLAGAALAPGAEVTLAFGPESLVTGSGGCNRLTAAFVLTRDGLSFGPPALTRMACSEDRMATEAAVVAALGRVARFDVAPDGTLELLDATDEPVLRAQR